jgi:hypothetical protein
VPTSARVEVLIAVTAVALASQTIAQENTCPVSKTISAEPAKDPNADRFGFGPWYVNAGRTIWVRGAFQASGVGNKTMWIRPAGTELVVEGQRLDAPAPPLRVRIPCCYPTGFQVTGMYFPTPGCWEVNARSGASDLRFVTDVGTSRPKPAPAR